MLASVDCEQVRWSVLKMIACLSNGSSHIQARLMFETTCGRSLQGPPGFHVVGAGRPWEGRFECVATAACAAFEDLCLVAPKSAD